MSLDLSIVIPLYNEDESLPELAECIHRVCTDNQYDYEAIMIDDGSTDNSWQVIESLRLQNPTAKGLKFQRNYGKRAALNEGFHAAAGRVGSTVGAGLQDSPDEIPELFRMIESGNYDMVS